MENNNRILAELQNFLKTKSNGIILNISSGLKLYYIRSLVDTGFITKDLQKPYFDKTIDFEAYFKTIGTKVEPNEDVQTVLQRLIRGNINVLYKNQLYKITGVYKRESRGVPDVEREASFEGGMEGFNEVTSTNINLVSQYHRQPDLMVKTINVGLRGNNTVALLYYTSLANQDLVKEVTEKLNNINVPVVQSLNGLQQLMWPKQLLVPRMLVTQRPDRVTEYLSKGKIVMFLDGTATALVLPVHFVEASLRLPKTIGQTATTVGGLILGQAAIQAHLVSNIMIIIVSTVAISNFMIPVISMNLSVRVVKYGLLVLVTFTGIYGIYLGLYCITCYLFSIKTFNAVYFNPIGHINLKGMKSFFRKGQ